MRSAAPGDQPKVPLGKGLQVFDDHDHILIKARVLGAYFAFFVLQ